jgi:hypothetical protein|nr:MAG TPA: hypothetical protein [Caudoviricetes sp.]
MKYATLPKVEIGRGAPMGRYSFNELPGHECRGSILPLRMSEGYDSGGAYWGLPNNVWVARFNVFTKKAPNNKYRSFPMFYSGALFVRANSRAEAIAEVNKTPGWEKVKFKT